MQFCKYIVADSGYCVAHPALDGLQYSVPAADGYKILLRDNDYTGDSNTVK